MQEVRERARQFDRGFVGRHHQRMPINYVVRQSDNVSFMLGDTSGEFELCFDAPGLRQFVDLANEALPKMAEHQEAHSKHRPVTRYSQVGGLTATAPGSF